MRKTNSLKYRTAIGEFVPIVSKLRALATGTLLLLLAFAGQVQAQECPMGCTNINLSLDTMKNGTVTVTPAMIMADMTANGCDDLSVVLYDQFNRKLDRPDVNCNYIGQLMTAVVIDGNTQNKCWSNIRVEDKAGPNLGCVVDTVYCTELPLIEAGLDRFPSGMAMDNCDPLTGYPVIISMDYTEYPCDSVRFAGIAIRRIVARDRWGTVADCNDTFYVERVPLDSIVCPADTMYECYAADTLYTTIDGKKVINPDFSAVPSAIVDGDTIPLYPNGTICKLYGSLNDHEWEICGNGKKIRRTWEIVDWCRDTVITCVQWIKIMDTLPPTADAYNDVVATALPHDCQGKVVFPYPTKIEDCSAIKSVRVEVEYSAPGHQGTPSIFSEVFTPGVAVQTYLPAGWFEGTIYITDACEQTLELPFRVHVLDETPPIPVCDEITQTTLDPNSCWARIYATTFDDGSHDNCCPTLHFSAARMSDVTEARNYWETNLKTIFGLNNYNRYYTEIQKFINVWLDCNVFGDYVEFSGCADDDQVVTRVYSTCHIERVYDPHLYGSSEQKFYCNFTYNGYAKLVDSLKTADQVGSAIIDAIEHIGDPEFSWNYYSECMTQVLVDDKVPPVCLPHEDVTVYCDGVTYGNGNNQYAECNSQASPDFAFHLGSNSAFDNCDTCKYWLKLDDVDILVDPYSYFSRPNIKENCSDYTVDSTTVDYDDNCNSYSERTWVITDNCGNSTTCSQRVYIKHRSDFEVIFPKDTILTCIQNMQIDASPERLGEPIISDDDCEQLGVRYVDEEYQIVAGACLKLLRTWTIIDWCAYNPDADYHGLDICASENMIASASRPQINRNLKDNGDGYMTYTQVIKLINTTPPSFTDTTINVVCASDANTCEGSATISMSASDDCSLAGDLKWTVLLSYEGGPEARVPGQDVQFGSTATLTDDYAVGAYVAHFIVSDRCGNQAEAYIPFYVGLCKKPTPYCHDLIITLMPVDTNKDNDPDLGMIRVWASDFDAGSYGYCGQDIVALSFSSDTTDTYRDFDCRSIGQQQLDMWVTDEYGNHDFCTVTLDVQDNMGACTSPDNANGNIAGRVVTETQEGVAQVNVQLKGAGSNPINTGVEGMFNFGTMPLGGKYSLVPGKNINPVNGISTLDLVYIQKHILGYEKLNSPYKIIAADIDHNGSITASDPVQLRRLILGVDDNFKSNTSWRFISSNYTFQNPENPLGEQFPESYDISSLSNNMVVNFIGIKVGDVNGSNSPNELQKTEIRTNESLTLTMPQMTYKANDVIEVPVTAENFNNIDGYQFTLEFNNSELSYAGVQPGVLNVTAANIGLNQVGKGIITTSWNEAESVSYGKNDVLFTIAFRALGNGDLEEAIQVNSKVTAAEAYNTWAEVQGVDLAFKANGAIASNGFALYQNNPNPFNSNTVIGFNLPEASSATLKIMDVTGKLIKQVDGEFVKGLNQITINKTDLQASGILYYQLETGKFTATRKMIIVE